jgi:peptide/nickel transport system substrate-binding protein
MQNVIRLIAVLACLGTARAEDLRIAIAAPATSLDPHFYNAAPNNSIAMHLFDRLTHRAPDSSVIPGLALAWKAIDDTTWEFKLRPGITFHDGVNLTPDDIAFTVARVPNVPNSPGGFGGFVRGITSVEAVDATTVRLHTKAPAPTLPGDMAYVGIISRHAGEGATTEDYNSGKAAIGTGAYRLVRYVSGDRVEMARYEGWWGPKPDWDRVTVRFISAPASRTAALLAGDVDIIDVPPASDLPRLRADPDLSVVTIQGARCIYIFMDFSRQGEEPFVAGNDGRPLAANPFLDLRVRRALSVAINRQGLAERVMQGTAVATGQWMPPEGFGYAPEIGVPKYDPEHAKALLAQAGYPQGFRLTLHTPNNRYPNDAETAQAVAQMWTRVGVQTTVEALPWASYAGKASHQSFSAGLIGWGSISAEATLLNVLGTRDPAAGRGSVNDSGYSDPAMDARTDAAMTVLDDTERARLLRQEVVDTMANQPIIPLFQLINAWASRKGIVYEPRSDERTVATNAHWVR